MVSAGALGASSDLQTLLSSGLAAAQEFDAWLSSSSTGYITRLYGYFYAISILASCWVFYVARGLPPGPWRALACLPVSALQLAVTPFLVDRHRTPVLIVPVMGIFSLSAFKVRPPVHSGLPTGSSIPGQHIAMPGSTALAYLAMRKIWLGHHIPATGVAQYDHQLLSIAGCCICIWSRSSRPEGLPLAARTQEVWSCAELPCCA